MKKLLKAIDNNINSLVDGELDIAESALLLEHIEQDSELQRELCDTHRIKDMMKMAYPINNQFTQQANESHKNWFGSIAASILLIGLGFLSGNWFTQTKIAEPFLLSDTISQNQKLVLFIGFSNAESFEKTLNKAEEFLKKNQKKNVQVNIVASSGGLDLFRKGRSSFLPRLHQMSKTYDALDFVACNNTISRLKAKGQKVDIIDEAIVAPTAVEFVVNRLKQGWGYLAI